MNTIELQIESPREMTRGRIMVTNPFDGSEVGSVTDMPPRNAHAILQTAKEGAHACRALSRHERARVLDACATLVERDQAAFTELIVAEVGKTIRQATKEVLRCVNTLRLSADEARRNAGEVIPFDAYAGSENRQGWFTREPLGVIVRPLDTLPPLWHRPPANNAARAPTASRRSWPWVCPGANAEKTLRHRLAPWN